MWRSWPNERRSLGRAAEHRERHDLVTARACAALPVLAELALPLLAVGGALLAWKGPLAAGDEELRARPRCRPELGGGAPSSSPPALPHWAATPS